jgi:UDP-2-acetamido-3-amino-2,3-dideoxy-glucuronate N-acetyltransferase
VVTRDVADYTLVYGNPAKPRGWVCQCGVKLSFASRSVPRATCVECGAAYERHDEVVQPV